MCAGTNYPRRIGMLCTRKRDLQMNYQAFLKQRLDAPSNGIIMDSEILAAMEGDYEFTMIGYSIVAPHGVTYIQHGADSSIALSAKGRSAGIASAIHYGWDVLGIWPEVEAVGVSIADSIFICRRTERDYAAELRRLLPLLSAIVSETPTTESKPIHCWLPVAGIELELWYQLPQRRATRNGYLHQLAYYLSRCLNTSVQLSRKGGVFRQQVLDAPAHRVLVSLQELQHYPTRRSIPDLRRILRERWGLECWLDAQSRTIRNLAPAQCHLFFEYTPDRVELPLWTLDGAPWDATRNDVLAQDFLATFDRRYPVVTVRAAESRVIQLDGLYNEL